MTSAATSLHHERILASAGSGKTFRLSGRLIEIARRDPRRPLSQILASTFTRAAAAEIRDRVFLRLVAAVMSEKGRRELAIGTGVPPPDEREAIDLLRRFVGSIDQLQLRTLDSLFASIAGAFAVELGLPPEPRIVDDDERGQLELDAIDRMLSADDAPALLASVAALNKGHARLTVASSVRAAVEGAAAVLAESEEGAWEWPPVPIADELTVARWVEALAACPAPADGRHARALAKDIASARAAPAQDLDAWSSVVSTGLVKAVREGETTYHRKPIDPAIVDAARPLVAHAQSLGYAETVRRTEATRMLAARFLDAFADVKRERGAVTFDDITRAVADAALIPECGELFFRLDAAFAHALFDEFQDTSAVQWRALAPIARELAAGDPGERSLFVVGDLKQSIYRWRGATPDLLDELPCLVLEGGRLDMRSEPMVESHRSAQLVLDAVDAVFASLPGNPALGEADASVRRVAEGWGSTWERHRARRDLPGVVELHVSESVSARADSREQLARTMETAAKLVADLRAASAHASIGVICRRNSCVGDMLNRLRALGIPASARGGGSLQDAASVNAALDAFVLADHPDHTIACFHVARSPLGPVVELDPDAHRQDRREHRRARSASIRRTLARLGYAETLRRWREALAPAIDAREMSRFDALIEVATAFDGPRAAARRPADVVRALRGLELREWSESPTTVMNIHQSKGLEFDAVVLCDLDSPFRMRASLAAMRGRADGRYTRVARWPAVETLHPALAPLVDRVTDEAYREQLSLLYVALTRARRGLFVVTGPAANSKGEPRFGNSFAGLVRGAWCPDRTAAGVEVRAGDRSALAVAEAESRPTAAIRSVPRAPIVVGPPREARMRAAPSPSARERTAPGIAAGAGAPASESRAARDRGTLVHAMLERIEWLGDELPSIDEMMAAGEEALARASGNVRRACAEWLRAKLSVPAIANELKRPPGAFLVRREFRFVRVEGAVLERGTIDRLVVHGSPGRVERATIVDFKSDRATANDVPALVERHRPQIDAYRAAMAVRLRLPPDRIEARLVFLDADTCVRL